MTEEAELQTIAKIVANPSKEGVELLAQIMRDSKFAMARVKAAAAILDLGENPEEVAREIQRRFPAGSNLKQ
jgi:hypothetical protein